VRCGFCECAGKITNEHVFGEWIGRLFGAGRGKLPMAHTLTLEGGPTRAWHAFRLDQQVRMACQECNGGWMSDLESKIQPVIEPMILGRRQVRLSLPAQILISTWAIKTAMVTEYLIKAHQRYFAQNERRDLMESGVLAVPGAHVWIGCFGLENKGSKGLMAGLTLQDRAVIAHVSVFALGHFAVQVFVERRTAWYQGDFPVRPGPWQQLLIEAWPPDSRSINPQYMPVWPPPLSFDDDGLGRLFDRFLDLRVERGPYRPSRNS
jgi:hypothetical protein